MYFLISYDTIINTLLKFGIEVEVLDSFQKVLIFLLGNIYWLLFIYFIVSIVCRLFRKVLRLFF